MKTSKKLIIVGIFLSLCIIGALVTVCVIKYSGTHARDIDAIYDPNLQQTTFRRNCVSITQDGDSYATSDLFLFYDSEDGERIISLAPSHMSVGAQGFAYQDTDSALYYVQGGDKTLVTENDCAFTMDGNRVIYFDESDSTVYAWEDGNSSPLFVLPATNSVDCLLGNECWIIIVSSGYLHVYQKDTEELKHFEYIVGGSYDEPLCLYRDWLIAVDGGKLSAGSGEAIHLTDFTSISLDFGRPTSESTNKLAVASDEKYLYLSIFSRLWPHLGEEQITRTIRLDPATWDIQIINDQFYPSLLCSEDGILYGNKSYSIRMDKIVDLKEFNAENS